MLFLFLRAGSPPLFSSGCGGGQIKTMMPNHHITLSVGHDREAVGATADGHQEHHVMQKFVAGVEFFLKNFDERLDVIRVPTPIRGRWGLQSVEDDYGHSRSRETLPVKTKYINNYRKKILKKDPKASFLHVEFHLNAHYSNQDLNGDQASGSEILTYQNTWLSMAKYALEEYCDRINELPLSKKPPIPIKNRGVKAAPTKWFLKKTKGEAWIWELVFMDHNEQMDHFVHHMGLYCEAVAYGLLEATIGLNQLGVNND